MRLKGGKLLLDLTGYGDIVSYDIDLNLSKEEYECILDKGLIVKINMYGVIFTFSPLVLFTNISSDIEGTAYTIQYQSLKDSTHERAISLNKHIKTDGSEQFRFSITDVD